VWDLCLSTGVGLRNEHVYTMYGFELPDPAAAAPDKAGTLDAQRFRDAVHPDDVDRAHSTFMQSLSSPTGSYDMVSLCHCSVCRAIATAVRTLPSCAHSQCMITLLHCNASAVLYAMLCKLQC
jgi:hypothetical protein